MRIYKPLLFAACLLPVIWLVLRIAGVVEPGLGANPAEEIQDELGVWALRLLLVTLCVTPAARLLKKPRLYRFRRMLGLFAFFYCTLHPLAYFLLDLQLDFSHLGEDLLKRTFITLGMGAVLLLIPLAVTSTRGWQRRLGRRWNRLHRLVYPGRDPGLLAFLLAGQGRHDRAAGILRHSRPAAGHTFLVVAP